MKIKRTLIGPGEYLISARDGLEILLQKTARCTGIRVGPNKKAWEYGENGQIEGVAFELREVEQRVLQEALQLIASRETADS